MELINITQNFISNLRDIIFDVKSKQFSKGEKKKNAQDKDLTQSQRHCWVSPPHRGFSQFRDISKNYIPVHTLKWEHLKCVDT